jgi:hypothetical protein
MTTREQSLEGGASVVKSPARASENRSQNMPRDFALWVAVPLARRRWTASGRRSKSSLDQCAAAARRFGCGTRRPSWTLAPAPGRTARRSPRRLALPGSASRRPARYSTTERRRPRKSLHLGGCCDHRADPRIRKRTSATGRRPPASASPARLSRHENVARRVRPVPIVGSVDPGQGPSWENADG